MLAFSLGQTVYPVIGIAAGVREGNDEQRFIAKNEREVVGKAGVIDAAVAACSFAPEKRLLRNCGESGFDRSPEASA
jgi:hypothetical protein